MATDPRAHEALVGLTDEELLKLAPEATHQHFKGGLYRYLGPARNAETGDYVRINDIPTISYLHLYPHKQEVWIRTRGEWSSNVPDPRNPRAWIPRFRKLRRGEDR